MFKLVRYYVSIKDSNFVNTNETRCASVIDDHEFSFADILLTQFNNVTRNIDESNANSAHTGKVYYIGTYENRYFEIRPIDIIELNNLIELRHYEVQSLEKTVNELVEISIDVMYVTSDT